MKISKENKYKKFINVQYGIAYELNQQQNHMKKLFQISDSSDSSSSESESEDYDFDQEDRPKKCKRRSTAIIPRFVKNQIEEIDTETITINISKTQYEVVETVAKQLGWEVEKSKKSQVWDVMWTDSHIEAHDLFKLNDHQKISHFPSIYVLTRKNFLGRSLMKMAKMFPETYNFFPQTWTIPADYNELMRYDENLEKKQFYIFKPQAQAQGKGIRLIEKIQELNGKSGIVQVYINDPFLIEGLKFDLRIYVLILGYDPLRIFIYDEGLGRFATESYKKAKKKNMKDVHMHLTNYAINKTNQKFIYNKSEKDMGKGHKRSLSAIYAYLAKIGVDTDQLKRKIDEVIIKTLIVGQPMIAHTYGLAQADNYANDLCFQILGFDILINQKLEPILLQVNHTPSFKTDTPLDLFIKKNLIKDALILLNINVEKKMEIINRKKEFMELRSKRKYVKLTKEQKKVLRTQKEKERNEYEQSHLGKYRKIFPSDQIRKYKETIIYANKIFNDFYGFKRKARFNFAKRPISNGEEKVEQKIPNESKIENSSKYSRTLEIRKEIRDNLQTKFPSLTFTKPTCRNLSGYMDRSKNPEMGKSQKLSVIQDPEQLKINLLQKQLATKGNYVAQKVHEMGNFQEQNFFIRQESYSGKLICSGEKSKMDISNKTIINKGRKFEDIVKQTTTNLLGFSLQKKIGYEALLSSLKNKRANEQKLSSKFIPKRKF